MSEAKRVCIYQTCPSKYAQVQINLNNHNEWKLVKTYYGEPRTDDTSFKEMLNACECGEIDIIIAKSLSRFLQDFSDILRIIQRLRSLDKPVGVYFEIEQIYTLDPDSDIMMSKIYEYALIESRTKSSTVYEPENRSLKFLKICSEPSSVIKAKRAALGMTQKEVSEAAGLPLQSYQRFEGGSRNVMTASFKVTCRILEALHIDAAEFYHRFCFDKKGEHDEH